MNKFFYEFSKRCSKKILFIPLKSEISNTQKMVLKSYSIKWFIFAIPLKCEKNWHLRELISYCSDRNNENRRIKKSHTRIEKCASNGHLMWHIHFSYLFLTSNVLFCTSQKNNNSEKFSSSILKKFSFDISTSNR